MQDAKLLTEIADALMYGIRTTDKKLLDSIYSRYDTCFPEKDDFTERILTAIDKVYHWKEIHNGPLAKPYMIYSLILAVAYVFKPTMPLNDNFHLDSPVEIRDDQALL